VISLSRLLGRSIDLDEVQDRIVEHFCRVFERSCPVSNI
jgi:hypothetical protein